MPSKIDQAPNINRTKSQTARDITAKIRLSEKPMAGIERKAFAEKVGNGSVIVDSTHFPVVVATWVGTLTNELVDCYFNFRNPLTEYADSIGTKVIVVTDVSRMETPAATVRKYIGDRAAEADQAYKSMFHYIVVVPSAILRGMVTAISWVMGEKGAPVKHTGSLESAFSIARKMYEQAGVECPDLPSDYSVTPPS